MAPSSAQKRWRQASYPSVRCGVVAGVSAAAALRVKWIDPSQPAELIHDNRKPPPNLVVRTERLLPGEVMSLGDMRVTTPARTAFDLGRQLAGSSRVNLTTFVSEFRRQIHNPLRG